jgi:thiaminase
MNEATVAELQVAVNNLIRMVDCIVKSMSLQQRQEYEDCLGESCQFEADMDRLAEEEEKRG